MPTPVLVPVDVLVPVLVLVSVPVVTAVRTSLPTLPAEDDGAVGFGRMLPGAVAVPLDEGVLLPGELALGPVYVVFVPDDGAVLSSADCAE